MKAYTDYAVAELMACVMARDFRDGELGAMGAASQIPMAAAKLARATHAPNLNWLSGGSGAINSKLPYLVQSAADYRNLFGAECRLSMEDIVDIEVRGRCDFSCYGAIQVDKHGNMNMLAVGADYKHPKVRGPGSVGLSLSAAFRRFYIYLTHHDPRILVEKVDYISGPGFWDGSLERDKYVQPGAMGPCLCVTPLGVFDFDENKREMRLKSVHPGVNVELLLSRTGFCPIVPANVPETEPPRPEERRLLREVIDREGILRRLID
jgi:glutaconate CoA-transferase, subunit B